MLHCWLLLPVCIFLHCVHCCLKWQDRLYSTKCTAHHYWYDFIHMIVWASPFGCMLPILVALQYCGIILPKQNMLRVTQRKCYWSVTHWHHVAKTTDAALHYLLIMVPVLVVWLELYTGKHDCCLMQGDDCNQAFVIGCTVWWSREMSQCLNCWNWVRFMFTLIFCHECAFVL